MEVIQINKLKMAQTTFSFLDDNAEAWSGIKGIVDAEAMGQDLVQQILENSLIQSPTTGFADVKRLARQTMVQTAFKVGCGLTSLASVTEDAMLASQTGFSRNSLSAGREQEVINRCQSLLTLGNNNADALAAKYNVSAKDLQALKTAIGNFVSAQPKPRQSISTSAAATAQLVTLFDQLEEVFNQQLDPLIETLQDSNTAFYTAYQTARTIVDAPATHEVKPAPAPQAPVAQLSKAI